MKLSKKLQTKKRLQICCQIQWNPAWIIDFFFKSFVKNNILNIKIFFVDDEIKCQIYIE